MTTARALTARLASLLATEHGTMADFLVALADFDRRRLWVELGYTSLFYYLHRELGLSKGAAFQRKVAAELLQRFPEAIGPLRDGKLCLSRVVELAKVLAPENRAEVLPRFFHCSAREAKEVLAELCPRPDPPRREVVTAVQVPQVTRKLVLTSEPTPTLGPTSGLSSTSTSPSTPTANPTATPTPWPPPRPPRDDAEPLTADLRRLHITVSRRFLEKVEAARDGLSHSIPGATAEQVLEAALDLLLERQAKRRGLVGKPRAPKTQKIDCRDRGTYRHVDAPACVPNLLPDVLHPNRPEPSLVACPVPSQESSPVPSPSHIPAHVRRAVWTRDGGRCQWRLDSGAICGATARLELDHVVPRARGGGSSAGDIRVICRFHNQLAARQVFGDGWMDRFARGP